MAMYSAHKIDVLLKPDTPEVILGLLQAMGEGTGEEYAEAAMISNEFTHEHRWDSLFSYSAVIFDEWFGEKQQQFELDRLHHAPFIHLGVKSANACHATEEFLKFIEPYIANNHGDLIGTKHYEETYRTDGYDEFYFRDGNVVRERFSWRKDDEWPGGFG